MLFKRRPGKIKRLLIVEDEPLIAFDIEHVLEDAGYEIVGTVDTQTDALALLDDQPIDLILTDIKLREGDGIAVARAAQARGVLVLLVTGSCPIDAPSIAVGCLAKPYTGRVLRAAVDAIDLWIGGKAPGRQIPGLTLYPIVAL